MLALIFVIAASRSKPGRVEREALEIRQLALASAASTLATATALVLPIRMIIAMLRRPKG